MTMIETVNTGGLKTFVYSNEEPIGYANYDEEVRIKTALERGRKRIRRNNIIKYTICSILVLTFIIYLYYNKGVAVK